MAKRGRKGKSQRAAQPSDARPQPASTAAAVTSEPAAPDSSTAEITQRALATARDSAAVGRSRALGGNLLIAAFLLFQIAMPLRYYLGGRGSDERFSWRMFSSVRMQRCDVQVYETTAEGGEQQLKLARELQVAWIGMLERNRPQVVEKLLRRRCAAPGVRSVRYARACKDTDGSELPSVHTTLDCARGVLETREGMP
jgi:hypothetical protein